MQQIFDTHRLSYKNARLRAFKLDNKTERLHWFNITETNTNGDDIGVIVYTNENGYICYGQNRQRVTGLAVAESAIIQVSLDGGINWPIEWVLKLGQSISRDDVGKLYYSDGSIAFDPLSGNTALPDFALRSEISQGFWAEEQIDAEDDSTNIVVSKWTSVINLYANEDTARSLDLSAARYGQKIIVRNASSHTIRLAGVKPSRITMNAGDTVLLGVSINNNEPSAYALTSLTEKTIRYKDINVTGSNTYINPENETALNILWSDASQSSLYLEELADGQTLRLIVSINGTIDVSSGTYPIIYYGTSATTLHLFGPNDYKFSAHITRHGNYLEIIPIQVI